MNTRLLVLVVGAAALSACSGASTASDAGCPASYCNGHGACAEVKGLPQCACESGYEGLTCVSCASGFHRVGSGTCAPDEACAADSCRNGGACEVRRGVVECTCPTGYDGPRCDVCLGGFVDVSDAGWLDAGADAGLVRSGPAVCALPATCTPGSCASGFTCDDATGAVRCTCESGACAAVDCSGAPCGGHGTCDVATGAVRCTCEAGYQGAACAGCAPGFRAVGGDGGVACLPSDQCTAFSCSGNGTCALDAGVASCRCSAGATGVRCEACAAGFHRVASGGCAADEACTASTCGAHATCVVVGGVASCPCSRGWAGAACDQCYPGFHAEPVDGGAADGGAGFTCALDERCRPSSCGGGACEDGTGAVVCSGCPTGFTGARCEVNVDDCGTACQTGTCVDLVSERVCLCTDGTFGQTCLPGPSITRVSPSAGPRSGGTVVTLTGAGFATGASVTVDGVAATGVNVLADSQLSFVTPPSPTLGVKDVVVRAANGQVARATFAYAPLAFTYTGALQSFTVPAGVTAITVEAWGAAGGGGHGAGVRGGAGGYVTGTFAVDAGQVLTVLVGQGGARWFGLDAGADGGGGSPADGGSGAGAGGGLSGVFLPSPDGGVSQAAALVVAGGGGGGGFFANVAFGSAGGNGGGAFGGGGAAPGTTAFDARGLGGSQQAGGVGGCSLGASLAQCGQTGLPLQGGGGGVDLLTTPRVGATFGGGGGVGRSPAFNAGGGGGGYFGGGGGANETAQGGGGGSGFVAASASAAATERGAVPGEPPRQDALGYQPGAAVGGNVDAGAVGGPGLVLIRW